MRSIASLPRLAGQISLQAITSVALAAALSWPFQAPAAEEFFAGKQIELIVGSAVGGGYDAYARFLTRHMGGLYRALRLLSSRICRAQEDALPPTTWPREHRETARHLACFRTPSPSISLPRRQTSISTCVSSAGSAI